MPDADRSLAHQIDYYRARTPEYDQWWKRQGRYDRGDANQRSHEQAQQVAVALEDHAPFGETLELACGTGWWTQQLAPHADALTAIDASPEAIDLCRQRCGDHIRFQTADLFAWQPDRQYDFVFFSFWLSHVPDDRFDAFWHAVRRALRPSGRAFFIDSLPSPESRARDHAVADPAATTQTRRLNDGRTFEIVKIYHDPDTLQRRLEGLGWRVALSTTADFFQYGVLSPQPQSHP